MSDEKKIFIDEDWKSQIASEREALERDALEKGAEEKAAQQQESGASGADTQGSGGPRGEQMLPPASLEMLLTTLAAEAMMSMGQMPVPGSDQSQKNLPQAKYVIDLIEVLEEKTEGNLTDQEEEAMQAMLHQLRLAYVAVQKG